MSGISRPAIAACFPTAKREVCMLDLGANLECDKNNLVQFAFMGQAFAKIVIGLNLFNPITSNKRFQILMKHFLSKNF